MDNATEHFADDPDLLEGFVLGRLDRTSLARYEEHLRTCTTCKQTVRAERTIAAGVKRYGRDQMKARLGALAGMPPSRRIPWPHVLSVAAVFLILLGIGIYQRWFVTNVEPKDLVALEAPQLEEERETAAQEPHNEQVQPPQSPSRSSESSLKQPETKRAREPQQSNAKKGKTENLGYAQAPIDRLEGSATTGGKDKRRADISQSAAAPAGGQQEFWANGTLITRVPARKEADEGKEARTMMSDAVREAEAHRAKADHFGQITLEQRPASGLPASLQSQQQLFGRQTIQTLVRQSEGETHLTLYPESPFDSTQLLFARAQQVSAESLVVQIGSQQIGYRFPAGTLGRNQRDSTEPMKR